MVRLFFDSDVILDMALERSPYQESAQQVFDDVEQKRALGFLSALACSHVYYFVRQRSSRATAIRFIPHFADRFICRRDLLQVFVK